MNLACINYEEKRNFVRMVVETPVTIKLNECTFMEGICHNLSGGGMLISIQEPLGLGGNLEVTVSSNHSHSPMLKARATVKRVGTVRKQSCSHGLKIEEVIE